MQNEIEARFLNVDASAVRAAFQAAGFTLQTPEYLMRRRTFDFSRVSPGREKWGRVRQEADCITMTIKEVVGTGIHDVMEVELKVDDFQTACSFFEACNIPEQSAQENYREVWVRNGVEATIDTWPGLNPLVEIEGPDEPAVREACHDLGFDFGTAVFGGVGAVYKSELGIDVNGIPELGFEKPPLPLRT